MFTNHSHVLKHFEYLFIIGLENRKGVSCTTLITWNWIRQWKHCSGNPRKRFTFKRGIHDDITKTAAPLPGVTSIKNKQHQGAQNTRLKNQAHTHKEMFMGLEELIEFSKEIFVAVLL